MTNQNLPYTKTNINLCSVVSCDKQKYCRGYCSKHYQEYKQSGVLTNQVFIPPKCNVDGCDTKAIARNLCIKHYGRMQRHGNTESLIRTVCIIEQCTKKHFSNGYCQSHYTRQRKYGDPLIIKHNYGVGETFEERFWSRVNRTSDTTQCWEWMAGRGSNGYGEIKFNGKPYGSHIIAWYLTNQIMPTLQILHSCDNKVCCNPNHLREGTHQENMQDKVDRNRQQRGEKVNFAKLKEFQVIEILKLFKIGRSNKEIAEIYNVTSEAINLIRLGKNWKYISSLNNGK